MVDRTSKWLHCDRVTTQAYVLTLLDISEKRLYDIGESKCMFKSSFDDCWIPIYYSGAEERIMFIPEVSLCLSPTAAAAGWSEQLSSTHCTNKSTESFTSRQVSPSLPLTSKGHWALYNGALFRNLEAQWLNRDHFSPAQRKPFLIFFEFLSVINCLRGNKLFYYYGNSNVNRLLSSSEIRFPVFLTWCIKKTVFLWVYFYLPMLRR